MEARSCLAGSTLRRRRYASYVCFMPHRPFLYEVLLYFACVRTRTNEYGTAVALPQEPTSVLVLLLCFIYV